MNNIQPVIIIIIIYCILNWGQNAQNPVYFSRPFAHPMVTTVCFIKWVERPACGMTHQQDKRRLLILGCFLSVLLTRWLPFFCLILSSTSTKKVFRPAFKSLQPALQSWTQVGFLHPPFSMLYPGFSMLPACSLMCSVLFQDAQADVIERPTAFTRPSILVLPPSSWPRRLFPRGI